MRSLTPLSLSLFLYFPSVSYLTVSLHPASFFLVVFPAVSCPVVSFPSPVTHSYTSPLLSQFQFPFCSSLCHCACVPSLVCPSVTVPNSLNPWSNPSSFQTYTHACRPSLYSNPSSPLSISLFLCCSVPSSLLYPYGFPDGAQRLQSYMKAYLISDICLLLPSSSLSTSPLLRLSPFFSPLYSPSFFPARLAL